MNSEEAYAAFVADIILSYFTEQQAAGRAFLYEDEIWKLLGQERPKNTPNRKFVLKEYQDNVIQFPNKNKLQ
jgi:hypothetical protein